MEQVVLSPIPLPDLLGEITKAVRTELDARTQPVQPPPEELLSRQEAANMLGVTLPTLRDYTRKGLVPGYRFGTRVRYKRNELLASLQRMRYAKTPRP